MSARLTAWCVAMLFCAAAQAQITSLNLGNYQLIGTFALPPAASEASAITYNWTNGNLFVLGDEGDAIVEVTRSGGVVSSMTLTGFDDTEGLTYIGNGNFVLAEERLQDAYLLTYVAGGTAARSSLASISVGDTVGNIGIEGLSYDPLTGKFFLVKEKSLQAVYQASLPFGPPGTSSAVVPAAYFDPASLGVLDLSDIQKLTTVPSLIGTADQDNLLIYSQESARLLEVSSTGAVLSQFDFSAIASDAEGVTIDPNGIIYIAGETPMVYVLAPVPEPSSLLLMAGGLGLFALHRRRKWRVPPTT